MQKIEKVVITRHAGLVAYLEKAGLIDADTRVIAHATPDEVRGKHTIGVLPMALAALAVTHTEVALNLPPHLRGVELTLEQVEACATGLVTYKVIVV